MRSQSHPATRAHVDRLIAVVLVACAVIAAVVLFQEPLRATRLIAGGRDGWITTCAGAAALALMWAGRRGRGLGDLLAGFALLAAYVLFERNQLVELFPMVAAIVWFAWRGASAHPDEPLASAAAPLGGRRLVLGVVLVLTVVHVVLAAGGSYADVARSSVTGGSALAHGRSPYEDKATISVLGNTYGPLLYEIYALPALLLSKTVAAKLLAALGHLALGAAVWFAARRAGAGPWGLVAVASWLALPASAYALSVGAHDDLVSAITVCALVVATPLLAGVLLGLATACKLYPALLLFVLLRRFDGWRLQLQLIAGAAVAFAATVVPIALVSDQPWVHRVWEAVVVNQGSRQGVHLWNVPLSVWRWDLPFNFWVLYDDQLPALHTLVKLLAVLAALWIAGSLTPQTHLRTVFARSLAIVTVLLLALDNLSWNYVSWFAPFVALALLAGPSDTAAHEPVSVADEPREDTVSVDALV